VSPSFEDSDVDLFTGPNGIVVMGYGTATPQSLAAYTKATVQAAAAHQCPAVPASDQAITVGGAPARLLSTRCQGFRSKRRSQFMPGMPSCSPPKSHPARVPIVPPSADSSPAYGSSGDV
jgi:hypothetical protein